MSDDISQYKDLYLQTSREYLQSLNENLLKLEKNQTDQEAIDEVFRSAHSLKSQSAAMGYEKTGFLCHTVEDVFYEIKQGRLSVTPELADSLFKALDSLTKSIDSIEADDREIDLAPQASELKQQTGVTTSGTGKSQRGSLQPDAAPSPQPSPPPNQIQTAEPTSAAPQKVKTITLPVERLDTIMNLIEDLTVHTLRMHTFVQQLDNDDIAHRYDLATKTLQNLQYEIMQARLIPVSVVFDHFPRTIRDLGRLENKKVTLQIQDDDLAIDRAIVERLDEPLIHLLRNAVSHGIVDSGTITITTRKERGWAIIDIHNDGHPIDWDKLKQLHTEAGRNPNVSPKDLLFAGISTAETVTSISGRGVGMNAVKETVESFGGQVDVESTSQKGTTFTLRFPLSLAIAKALLVMVGQTEYAIPINAIDRIVKVPSDSLKTTADQEVLVLEKTEIPLIHLDQILDHQPADSPSPIELTVVVVRINEEKVGLIVTGLIDAVDIVVKPLPETLQGNRLFSGTTILENGQTTLIINPSALVSA